MLKKFKSLKANKKGFTLAELLIVVAIIAVLAAIAIPVFASQLTAAKEAVDTSNLRAAASMASAEYQLSIPSLSGQVYYTADISSATGSGTTADNMVIKKVGETWSLTGTFPAVSDKDLRIQILVDEGGKIVSAKWVK